MIIQQVVSKIQWQQCFDINYNHSFLHSWEWGELQKKLGYEIIRLGIYDNQQLKDISLVIKIRSKRGDFLFVPHSNISNKKHLKKLLRFLIEIAKKESFSFIRIAPALINNQENRKIFFDLDFKTAPIYMHAERTWALDLNKSEEDLLNSMRKTTRYLIKRADRDGVIIEERNDEQAFNDFWRLYQKTAEREDFTPYSLSFIKKEYEAFHKTGNALFLFGKLKTAINDYYAATLILFTKLAGFYHQGASIHSKFPVTYRLQWEAIKAAKKRGCQQYNFWGIKQEGRTPKNWGGLTLFKTGFGGRQIDYVPTQDYILSPKYYLTFIYEKCLAWKRGV